MLNPIAFKVPMQNNMSVRVEECNDKHDYDLVHFHEECQLTCIIKGRGSLLAGTVTYEFLPGEVYLFGSNMPHGFKSHDHEAEVESESSPSKISVFFKRDVFDSMFVQNPETAEIKTLLDNASLGYRLSGQKSLDVLSKIQNLVNLDGFDRVLELLQILDAISKSNVGHYLSDEGGVGKGMVDKDILRINEIFAYTESHF
ncbi:MAG: hypothetical protein HKM92_08465, partial [Arenibacter sp.]|nr:hypothetical protein [Arenibacter sp.]